MENLIESTPTMEQTSSGLSWCFEKRSSTFTSRLTQRVGGFHVARSHRVDLSAGKNPSLWRSTQEPHPLHKMGSIFCFGTKERMPSSSYRGHSTHTDFRSCRAPEFQTTNLRELRPRGLPTAYTKRLSEPSNRGGSS